ncbi:MAG: GNAT family N-acetyltransferase [Lachnospiraceae bacterium]|nr:GNAT family N-acetyltransferase [Lachnospiraceae bacterium]
MRIRHAVENDIDELTRIEVVSYPLEEGASRESISKRVAVFPECFWILEEEGHIKAFINGMATDEADLTDEMYDCASMHKRDGKWQMIFSVVTAPDCRGKGYASKLMWEVIADSKKKNRAGIVLTCKEKLLGFYEQFGFQNEGISASTHGGVRWYQMRREEGK